MATDNDDKLHLRGPSMEQRIANRLRNSGAGATPDSTTQTGNSPTRTITNLHHSPGQKARNSGEGERK
jgi:hypothetical protein